MCEFAAAKSSTWLCLSVAGDDTLAGWLAVAAGCPLKPAGAVIITKYPTQ